MDVRGPRELIDVQFSGQQQLAMAILMTDSHSKTLISGLSASRRATTEPEAPDPQTMKS